MKRLSVLVAVALLACGDPITAPRNPARATLASGAGRPSLVGQWDLTSSATIRLESPGAHVFCGGGGSLIVEHQREGRFTGVFTDSPTGIAAIITCDRYIGEVPSGEQFIFAESVDTGTVTRTGHVRIVQTGVLNLVLLIPTGERCVIEAQLSDNATTMTGTRRCGGSLLGLSELVLATTLLRTQ